MADADMKRHAHPVLAAAWNQDQPLDWEGVSARMNRSRKETPMWYLALLEVQILDSSS